MAYSELLKNFNKIRDYMREFYVYGFKSRDEFTGKSPRSYDDERRRLESWLGEYMRFRHTHAGKNVFISIDSRESYHNPLFKAWKAKSFTDGDITLHFILFDILCNSEVSLTIDEIITEIDRYLAKFVKPRMFDESTIRKKLKEYAMQGLIISERKGRAVYYRRADDIDLPNPDMLDFFSEVLPCGVIGSFLLDKAEAHESRFAFKHHYITGAMDSEVIYLIFNVLREKRSVSLEMMSRNKNKTTKTRVVPLKLLISVQSGRSYLMAYSPRFNRINSFRTDNIISVKAENVSERFDELRDKLAGMLPHMWGVSTQSTSGAREEEVSFTIHYKDDEQYIINRLEREKRFGMVEHIDSNTARFSMTVFDSGELIPWIRTFIGRITEIHFSDKILEEQFRKDINDMYAIYGIGGDE